MSKPHLAAIASLALLTGLAFGVASLSQNTGWLSLIPPATDAVPNPVADVAPQNALALYQSAFTAWSALILLIPAYWFYLTQGAGRSWLAFWGAAYAAYLVHLYVAAVLFFGGDFAWMTTSPRVSAFWPGMLLIPWWGIDLLLGARGVTSAGVRIQRGILHLGVFVLFFGGSAVKGEMAVIRVIGLVFAAVAIAALVARLRRPDRGATT